MKLLAVILVAAALSLVLGFAFVALGNYMVEKVYCSPARTDTRLKDVATSFRGYIEHYGVNVNEAEIIGLWNQAYPYVKLSISANGAVVNSDRYGAELIRVDSGLIFRTEDASHASTVVNVNFSGGSYPVQIQEFSEERLYWLVDAGALIVGSILFLLLVLMYHRRVTLTISRLASQVGQVIHGDLNLSIKPTSKDEIGDLAEDVEAMRLSVLERLRKEEEAWNANSQLITAMSHDVRTPLTTLIGFLELMDTQPGLSEEKRRAYLSLCINKAMILRELTEELFSYTILFGKPQPDTDLAQYDAAPLLEQLLGEHSAELNTGGFQVEILNHCTAGHIRADAQHLFRVFGNLFSNIRKYGDKREPVKVSVFWVENNLFVELSNAIRDDAGLVESNKIGLKTCEKLLSAMGGNFARHVVGNRFIARVILPGISED